MTSAPPCPGISDDTWDTIVTEVMAARNLLLLGHVSPDGDALGSALAVGLAIQRLPGDRRVQVSFGDEPFVVPANLAWLPGLSLLAEPSQVVEPDVVVTFDASSADRLGLLRPVAEAADHLVVVDHHASYDGFGTIAAVDVRAPATAVLADELIRRCGGTVDHDVAANLYTGLVTDTGSFRYVGTTPETHALAGRLLQTGIRFDLIARELFDTVPFDYLGLLGRALDRSVLERDAAGGLGLVWTVVPALERQQLDLAFDMVEPIIDTVRKAAQAEVACVVKEDDLGQLRVSMRSKGHIDLSVIAMSLGGGGHRYAAGFTAATRDLDVVIESVRAGLREAPHLVS
ncbi:MAG: bifunctional oligoribonuclease/PAP phosphatase NrnA [Actinomycetes bacterium]